ncbi:hypothetical protein [Thermococcus gammatolerans]|uniref:DUF3352 domain-containing protein n=1 Tax=Thermococcus gammatolerans (strain DSM 15229 / JCM 11827 / EJ3) TaxID=593117 RepID=C5A6L1_THEGJ|nr:hypothetical protein [Thermococcus gammatolerans]ACS33873.1 Hypothetical protein TGAM_1371 [Thermococcus gammatolerans EJ3]
MRGNTRSILALFLTLVFVLSMATLSSGCIGGSNDSKEWVKLVPKGSFAAFYVDAKILSDESTESLMRALDVYHDYKKALNEIEDSTNVSPSDVEWGLFVLYDLSLNEEGDVEAIDFAVYIKGKFNTKDLVKRLKNSTEGIRELEYRDVTLYKWKDYDGTYYGAVIESDYVLIGTLDVVEKIIDLKKGKGKYDEEMSNIADEIGDGYIVAVSNYKNLPSGLREEFEKISEEVPTIPFVSLLSEIKYEAFVYRPVGNVLTIKEVTELDSEESADTLVKSFEGSLAMLSTMPMFKENEKLKKLVRDNIKVQQEGTKVIVTIEVSVDQISEIVTELKSYESKYESW